MERPSLRQLECVVAVADHLSFRRAAESLFITQPALSAQVQQLETHLGLRLFERDRRRVLVTPAGEELVARARRVLDEADAFVEAAEALEEPLTGTLRLGVIPTVAPYVLPRAVPAIRKAYPRLRLLLREEQTATLVRRLREGELDLLLLALEAELGELSTRPLYRDPFVVAVPQDHPLAGRKRLRQQDLDAEEVLLLEDGHCLRDQALEICRVARVAEVDDFRATSLNTLVRMVSGGVGITLLPAMAVATEVRGPDRLVTVAFGKGGPGRTIGLAWRPTSARGAEYEALAGLLERSAPRGVETPS